MTTATTNKLTETVTTVLATVKLPVGTLRCTREDAPGFTRWVVACRGARVSRVVLVADGGESAALALFARTQIELA